MSLEQAQASFRAAWETGLKEWDRAMATGETAPLEAEIPDEMLCYFGLNGTEPLAVYDRTAVITGMRQSVGGLRGCTKRFENPLIRMRSETEAVIFFEQVVCRGDDVLARLFTMETYRLMDGHWRCVREVVEHLGA